jgi:hypothetical protein
MPWNEYAAFYAACVSTGLLLWTIYRDSIRDRGKLVVSAWIGESVHLGGEKVLFIRVTNIGRRSITIDRIRSEWADPEKAPRRLFRSINHKLPRSLGEGEFWEDDEYYLARLSEDLKAICAVDSAGKRWYVPNKQLKKIFVDTRKAVAEGHRSATIPTQQ